MPNHVTPKIIMNHLHHIILNQKLSGKFEKWCKFSSCFMKTAQKRTQIKRDLPVLVLRMKLCGQEDPAVLLKPENQNCK
jgi:hypothetical protein